MTGCLASYLPTYNSENIGFLHEVLMNHICRLSRVNEKEQKMSRIKNLAEELYGEDWSEVLEDLENGGQDH